MRIRTVKPEFFNHEGLYDLEAETGLPIRIAFIGLWCAADREGRFKWEPRRLGVAVLPYDEADFSAVLDALLTRGFLVRYRVNNADYGLIPTFTKHQVINNRERESDLPEPAQGEVLDATATRAAREEHADTGEGKGREQGKERKGTTAEAEEIYQSYPRKEAKKDALKAIEKALKTVDAPTLLEHTRRFAIQRKGQDHKFTPLPASWFNGERWNDEPAAAQPAAEDYQSTLDRQAAYYSQTAGERGPIPYHPDETEEEMRARVAAKIAAMNKAHEEADGY